MIRTDRTKAEKRGKYDAIGDRALHRRRARGDRRGVRVGAGNAARGAEPRWWEDVEEGDEVGPIVKGPLRVTDMVCWHVGMGMGLYGVKALRLGYQQRQRVPRFFRPDDLNIPDVQQRVHWDAEWARRAGNPAIYDYGRMRETWLVHLCTDWMGDDAWLWKLDCEFRRFNYVGDTHWMRGRVVRQFLADGDRPAVELDVRGREPARRDHHARDTRRSCCRAASTARSGSPIRPAAHAPPRTRSALVDRFAAMEPRTDRRWYAACLEYGTNGRPRNGCGTARSSV